VDRRKHVRDWSSPPSSSSPFNGSAVRESEWRETDTPDYHTHFTRTNNSGLEIGQDSTTQWLPVAAECVWVCVVWAAAEIPASGAGCVYVVLLDDPSSSRTFISRRALTDTSPSSLYYNSVIYSSHSDRKNNDWPSGWNWGSVTWGKVMVWTFLEVLINTAGFNGAGDLGGNREITRLKRRIKTFMSQ